MPKAMKPILYATALTLGILPPALHAVDQPLSFVGAAFAKNNGDNGKSEGKGGGSSAGNAGNKGGGSASSNKGSASASGGAANGQGASRSSAVKQTDVAGASKGKGRSDLGRWNAAKDIDHPAIQAHIRNGNFKGTIGLNAAYVLAQANYNNFDEQELAAAQAVVGAADLPTLKSNIVAALAAYNQANGTSFTTAEAYKEALAATGSTITPDPVLNQAIADLATVTDAQKLLDSAAASLQSLADAEAAMAAASNKGIWTDIRGEVRKKMGLDPIEDDVLAATTPTTATVQASDLY